MKLKYYLLSAGVMLLASFTANAQLYPFNSHGFSSATATGLNGPTLGQCQTAYSAAPWASNTAFLNMYEQGIQVWTVPVTANYKIEAAGAKGADGGTNSNQAGGKGAYMSGEFLLTQGTKLRIIVGQEGLPAPYESGGGGGSFVYTDSSAAFPMIAAGGGGGAGRTNAGVDADTATAGTAGTTGTAPGGPGGTNGNGGSKNNHTSYSGAGGAGWLQNGQNGIDSRSASYMPNSGGKAPRNGAFGGDNTTGVHNPDGGFGGGGAGRGWNYAGAGGGGGFSGGGAGGHNSGGGGGAGSYNSGSNQLNIRGANDSIGYVIITKLCTPDSSSQTVNICAGDTFRIGSSAYGSSGVYQDVLQGATCDSIVTTTVNVAAAINNTVTQVTWPLQLVANETGATYQWLDCNNNMAVIPGATSQTYNPTANGNYAVEVTVGNCKDTSACEAVTTVGIDQYGIESVTLAPNPTDGMFKISVPQGSQITELMVIDLTGRTVLKKEGNVASQIDISTEASGVYFVKVTLDRKDFKVFKLEKQ